MPNRLASHYKTTSNIDKSEQRISSSNQKRQRGLQTLPTYLLFFRYHTWHFTNHPFPRSLFPTSLSRKLSYNFYLQTSTCIDDTYLRLYGTLNLSYVVSFYFSKMVFWFYYQAFYGRYMIYLKNLHFKNVYYTNKRLLEKWNEIRASLTREQEFKT